MSGIFEKLPQKFPSTEKFLASNIFFFKSFQRNFKKKKMNDKFEIVIENNPQLNIILGEGSYWDFKTKCLYWVKKKPKNINFF